MTARKAVMLTGTGKRYDIVSAFAQHTRVIACDPNPLSPAQYAATVRTSVPMIKDPDYVPALRRLVEEHDVGAIVPLTDLDIDVLAHARADGRLPQALVPDPVIAESTYDKHACHLLLEEHGLPSPPTVRSDRLDDVASYPVMVKPIHGSGARNIFPAQTRAQAEFFIDYIDEPVMLQRLMDGPEFSIDCLSDRDGRCLNAIPRTMLESRGGESIKGTVIADQELIDLGRRVVEAFGVRGPATVQVFRDAEIGYGITDVNTRFGGAFPAPVYAARAGQTYPELIARMADGEAVEPHVGDFLAGRTFTRYFWQVELDEDLRPTGRDIVSPPGPPAPR
ncbi:MAG TPA: ATP-grasp domain-containing protein [Baekduia sp.]|uniref:ATP-grasp domain-containing protein n=1 Tax=Baekduia sp. TaxID=2600305 RepID=UPI002D79D5E0|nr:ATP-grasp domain-containing protein [Baekduia sp.]HET6508935.1 ATP-grasp domain-containing protein [Baekduia sp.]